MYLIKTGIYIMFLRLAPASRSQYLRLALYVEVDTMVQSNTFSRCVCNLNIYAMVNL